jgi:hypothetical protein
MTIPRFSPNAPPAAVAEALKDAGCAVIAIYAVASLGTPHSTQRSSRPLPRRRT